MPINNDERFQARLTGLWRDSGTEIDQIDDDRKFLAPAFTWQPEREDHPDGADPVPV